MSDACAAHPDELAGWRCESCKQLLCGECTARAATLDYCAHCDARAVQRVQPRTERSLSHWIAGAFAYPLTRGLPIVAVTAIVLGGIGYTLRALGDDYAGWSIGIRAIVLAVFAVVVVDATARGEIGERGVVLRVGRALLATAIVWAPAAIGSDVSPRAISHTSNASSRSSAITATIVHCVPWPTTKPSRRPRPPTMARAIASRRATPRR